MRLTAAQFVQALAMLVAGGMGGGLVYSYWSSRLPPIPHRPLRIGFEVNPPFQIRTESGFGGLAVEIVNEAAKRAGIRLQWVETGTSSDEAFQKGLVDLWPLMGDLPERRKRIHFSQPWILANHILLVRASSAIPDRTFTGRIGIFKLPVHMRLVRSHFSQAQPIPFDDARHVLLAICKGGIDAGFLEKRVAMTALQEKPLECGSTAFRVHPVNDATLNTAVASTFETAGAADRLRTEIGRMYRDGSLVVMMAKYSYYGLDDAWATYDLMETAERSRWLAWGSAGLAVALILALWQTVSLRQRKRSERVLRESEERFRAIFLQAGVGVAQVSLDGKVEMANDRYCQVVGHSRHDLLGKGTVEITHRDDLREQLAMMPRLLRGEIQSFSTEKRYTRDDGSVVWAEICKSLVRDVDGKPTSFITVVEDITERKRAEEALKESEKRFRSMADSAPVMIWLSGTDRVCTFLSKGWLDFTGRTMEQELGEGWAEGIHSDDLERCIATYMRAFEQRRDFQMEYRLRRADGEYRFVLDHGVARFSPDGAFAGYIGSCIDISDFKRNYEQHLATQKLESLGILAAGVAHDFNNLLGAMIARAELAQTELAADSPASEDINQIRVTALRAAEIVSQLMTFARQENAPSAALNVSDLVSEILDLLKVSIAKTAVLQTELAADLPLVYANAAEIRQVVMNLIINASEALEGKPGCITVTTATVLLAKQSKCVVSLEVRDTGSGMTEAVKAQIFDPFFSTRFLGRGLGLSAVQGIVRRHGGSIQIETAPGQGSRFTVLLPCADRQWVPAAPPAERYEPAGRPHETVLLIEDEDSLRLVVAKVLRRKHFEVIEAADGSAAVEILKSARGCVGLCILDVTLPGISGSELFDELRRIQPGIKVILSTAYTHDTVMRGFQGRDISGFIRKPYRTDELIELLHKATNGSFKSHDS